MISDINIRNFQPEFPEELLETWYDAREGFDVENIALGFHPRIRKVAFAEGVIHPADLAGRDTLSLGRFWELEAFAAGQWNEMDLTALGLTAAELWVVMRKEDSESNAETWKLGAADETAEYETDGILDGFGSTVRHDTGAPSVDLTSQYRIYRARSTNGEWTRWIDGVEEFTTASNVFGMHEEPRFFLEGYRVAEIAIAPRALTATEAATAYDILNGRWFGGVVTPPDPGPQDPPADPPAELPDFPAGSIYGMVEIPETGYPGGFWNSTIVKAVTPSNAVTRFNAMRAANMQNMWMPQGFQTLWAPNRQFNLNLYLQSVRRWASASSGRSAALDAIADGTIPYIYLIDEPRHPTRYGPGGISLSNLRTMAAVMRETFPDCPIAVRMEPSRYNAVIPGVDAYWFVMKVNRGPLATVIPRQIAEAEALGARLGCSLNCRDFNDTGGQGSADNEPQGWITPAQMRLYGTQLASFSDLLFLYGWWIYTQPEWYEQAGMAAAVSDVGAAWIATHP